MFRIYFTQVYFLILFVFGCIISTASHASTESEIEARLKLTFDVLIHELPKIESKVAADHFIRFHLIPITDMTITSRLMLGKHWRIATESQRKRFISAMTEQLIDTYSVFLIGNGTQDLEFKLQRITTTESKRAIKYMVYSTIIVDGSPPIDVTFKIYKRPTRDWKIVDVSIEGISLVLNWRNTLNSLIKTSDDLEAEIVKLENKTKH